MEPKEVLNHLIAASKLAAEIILKEYESRNKKIESKISIADLVTQSDKDCERVIREYAAKHCPDHKILAEESAESMAVLTDAPTWIIDPIDGTMNFSKTNKFMCVSIGFTVNKVPVAGVVNAPAFGEIFTAVQGEGAFCNGEKIRVAEPIPLAHAIVNTGFCTSFLKPPASLTEEAFPETHAMMQILDDITLFNFNAIRKNAADLRRSGASALELCLVASGRLDASFEIGNKEWDLAAGTVILREAGGCVVQMDGRPLDLGNRNYLAASGDVLAQELASVIKSKPDEPFMRRIEADIEASKSG